MIDETYTFHYRCFYYRFRILDSTGRSGPIVYAFIYQGKLNYQGAPLDDEVDLRFRLYDDRSRGDLVGSPNTVEHDNEDVQDGLVMVELDFGSAVFDGSPLWLEIGVRDGRSSGEYTVLIPRQPITPGTLCHSGVE